MPEINPFDEAINWARELFFTFYNTKGFNPLKYKSEFILAAIINEYKIVCDYIKFSVEAFCGMLTVDKYENSIVVNQNHPKPKRMFTIGHELGHFFLHKEKQSQFIDRSKDMVQNNVDMINNDIPLFEQQANVFASEILLPENVISLMLSYKYNYHRIALSTGTSYACLKWRLVRYFMDNYHLTRNQSLLLIKEYEELSIAKRQTEACVFKINEYNIHKIIGYLEEKEDNKKNRQYELYFSNKNKGSSVDSEQYDQYEIEVKIHDDDLPF